MEKAEKTAKKSAPDGKFTIMDLEKGKVVKDLDEKVRRVAGREDVTNVLAKLEALKSARWQLERNLNPQLVMEVLLLRLAA